MFSQMSTDREKTLSKEAELQRSKCEVLSDRTVIINEDVDLQKPTDRKREL